MTSASKKRRRRRERAEGLLQRAREISLVDVNSPLPAVSPSSTNERRQGCTDPQKNHLVRNKVSSNDSSVVGNPNPSPTNMPKETSWKRVDFVLPRAGGKKRFIFDRQTRPGEINSNSSSEENGGITSQNSKKIRISETIEDILFAGKRHGERVPGNNLDFSPDQDEGCRKKSKVNGKNDNIISESQRRKLEHAFESVHQAESSVAIVNCLDMPKTKKKNGAEKSTFLSSDEAAKATLTIGITAKKSDERYDKEKKKNGLNITQPSPGQISGRTVKEAVRDKRGLRPRANSTDGELNLPRGGLCDERMILEAHKWNPERKFTNQPPPRGFHNLGNTCFLNATLQCLTYLPPLCQTLISISKNRIDNEPNVGKRKISQGQTITSSLCNLFQQAHGLNSTTNSSKIGGPFAPKKLVNLLSNIGSCGSRSGYKFRLGRQEDAHEFLVHLLDAMNDGELRAAGINQTISGWRDRLPVSRLDETTFVHRIFGGYFRSQVRCRKCNYKSNTYDPFLDLSLEVSKKSSTSVLKALSEFTRKETLDAANQWKCSGCKKYVCATKQLTVFRPPLTLFIQLKRFAFDNNFGFGQKYSKHHHGYGGGGGSKITKPIEFPGTLHLPLSDSRSCQYTLTGIVIHVGGSSQSGHYTAYVKKPGKNGSSQWYHMDDSHVQPVSEKTVLKQKDAYLLFYCRTEVKLEFPDPPSKSMSASEATKFGRTRAIARANSLPPEEPKKNPLEHVQIRANKDSLLQTDKKISRSQEGITAPCSRKKQKDALHKIETPSPRTTDVAALNFLADATKLEKSSTSFSSSSSNHKDSAESRISKKKEKRKDKKIVRKANNNSNAPSSDSSHNECSIDINASSGNFSSSQKENQYSSNATMDDPFIETSAKKEENHLDGRSFKFETLNETSFSFNDKGNMLDKKSTDFSNNSEQSAKSEETNSDGGSSLGDKKKIQIEKGKKGFLSSVKDSTCPKASSESEIESEGKSLSNEENIESAECSKRNPGNLTSQRTQVVLNNTDSRGKVKVVLGPRKRKVWESITSTLSSKDSDFKLLGNMKVSQWDDINEDDSNANGDVSTSSMNRVLETGVLFKRKNIIEKIGKNNRSRKRKMHLDRWDSHLDQGKRKKVKSASDAIRYQISTTAPKKNVFQRIQSGVQRMTRGKPKGHFGRNTKNRKGKF